jgi:alpha-glucosidase
MRPLYALPHHDGSERYAPVQDAALGEAYVVRVRVPREFGRIESAAVRVVSDGEPCFHALSAETPQAAGGASAEWWSGQFLLPNPVTRYRFLLNGADGAAWWLSADGLDSIEPTDARDFRVTTFVRPPEWATSQVMYQIFPDRFERSARAHDRALPDWAVRADWSEAVISTGPDTSRQVFGGDLDGVVDRLDHLEHLGVTLLYLTPFFPARSNHRYDASTFDAVDPLLGGDRALIRLVEAAHARGMRVIGDLTTNHTGAGHEWFTAALGNPSAEESSYYYWTNPEQTEYVSWYGVPSLPKLNWDSEPLRRRFIDGADSVVAKWLQPPYNLDGWRIDVANMTGRLREVDLNREVQRTVRRTMEDVAPGRVLYAESTNDAAVDFDGEGWQAPMSYSAFTRPVWQWLRRQGTDLVQRSGATFLAHHFGIPYRTEPQYTAADVVSAYRRFTAPYPWAVRALAMNAIDTHDTPRFAHQADEAAQIVAAGLSMTLPGTPVVYAGDEFGLRGSHGEDSRTPLPWHSTPRLADAYGRLAQARRQAKALQRGGLRWLHADDDCMVFVRELEDEAFLVFASSGRAHVELPSSAVGSPAAAGVSFGGAALDAFAGTVRITSAEASFAVWALESRDASFEPAREDGRSDAEGPVPAYAT